METQLIGAALGAGAQDSRTRAGAQALKDLGLLPYLRRLGFDVKDFPILESAAHGPEPALLEALPMIAEFNERLAQLVQIPFRKNQIPIVIGGDHSIAAGTWSGLASATPNQDWGLLWIDAHMDAHTPATTETGAVHGMPVASLLGHGDARLTQILSAKPKIKPENLCLLGVRSFEAGEARTLRELGVRVYFIDEIERRGFRACWNEARERLRQRTSLWGVSLDLDALDPEHFTAVGSPVQGGLRINEVAEALSEIAADPRFRAFEMVEYNPALDEQGLGFPQIVRLLAALMKSLQKRHSGRLDLQL